MTRINTLILAVIALVGSTGCATVYVKKSPKLENLKEPQTALLATSVVYVGQRYGEGDSEGGLINAALNVAMNAHLEAFGVKVTEAATAFVAQHGLKVVTDPERAKKLSLINFNETAGDAMTALGGVWYAPEGSTKHLDSSSTILFGKRAFIEAADDTHPQRRSCLFPAASMRAKWLIMKKPVFRIEIRALDEDGEDLLRVSGMGEGDAALFVMDRDGENLSKALEGALNSLRLTEVENL